MILIRCVGAMVIVLLLWACAALSPTVERPRAEVRDVRIESIALTGLRGEVALDVHNPNAFAVPLEHVDWELQIGDADAVEGRVLLEESIPARASAPVEVDLHLDGRDAAALARRLAAGERRYTLRGVMHFATALGAIPVSFVERGDISDVLERISRAHGRAPASAP